MNATHLLMAQHRAIEALFDDVAHETRRVLRARAARRSSISTARASTCGTERENEMPRIAA